MQALKSGKCRMCPSKNARDIRVDVELGGKRRAYTLHLCKWDWRALEAMLESADPMPQVGLLGLTSAETRFMW